jgi:AcrR family transcriptional regulator
LEQGYKNTSVSQIVDEAGVARGSYLNLFPTKDKILLDLTETMFDGQFGVARSIADGKLPPVYCLASEINQVLLGVLLNASQAIAERGQITLRTSLEGSFAVIEISDDGCGMTAEDLPLALSRHATSKIDGSDLLDIRSFGFRGEALAAIASVSETALLSRPADPLQHAHHPPILTNNPKSAWKIQVGNLIFQSQNNQALNFACSDHKWTQTHHSPSLGFLNWQYSFEMNSEDYNRKLRHLNCL